MELLDGKVEVVDPVIRAHVASLVVALGGSGADEDGRYELGDDALACLRDIKKWLKIHDERNNRLDVARCLAEQNLVGGDLLQILSAWQENETDDKVKYKIALACLELLVPLTWPLEKSREMTNNHLRHTPYLELAQLGYKRDVINWDFSRILKTGVRIALPPIAVDLNERSTRDQGIIKLVLYFLRNIAMIAPSPSAQYDRDEAEISRSATIDAFDYQDIFDFILPLSSSMGEDFNTEDVVIMEVIFHLIKGVNIDKLFMSEKQLETKKGDELANLRKHEASLLRDYKRTAPTRHNRFGTMVWVKGDDHKMSVVSGQDALIDSTRALAKMDKSKRFRPPRRAPKDSDGPMDFDTPVTLSARANDNLRKFVEQFLDAGFNPLFQHIRKALDREAERVQAYHSRQFFYLISWFLEAERVRRKSNPPTKTKDINSDDLDNFGIVASVLNQETFITLNKAMEKSYEDKSWQDLNAAMRCFTQILLTVQEMTDSPLEEDQEIAENILSRIFYEETTHDRVANIVRYYKDQGFGYLDACTELAHVYLRILENYSKVNPELQVRSKRRIRRKKKNAEQPDVDVGEDDNPEPEWDDFELQQAVQTANERKFDFKRFSHRFLSQGTIDTFVSFCTFYNDLKPEQLKRCHRYFFRVAFKMEMSVMLFRVDIIHMLHKMIKGPQGLDPQISAFKEWDELVRQLIRKCTKKIRERPELIVEMLFSKTNGTAHYLEYGYEKQTITTKSRPAAELEVKGDTEWDEKVAIAVSILLDKNEGHHLEWLKAQLSSAEVERAAWEAGNKVIPAMDVDPITGDIDEQAIPEATILRAPSIPLTPNGEICRTALFKNGHLRLLLILLSFQNLSPNDEPDTAWIIPSSLTSGQLRVSHDLIKATEFNPPIFDDGISAEDQIRRKSAAPRKKVAYDDDSDGIDDQAEELLFEPGGPTVRPKSDALAELRKNRRKRRNSEGDDEGRTLTEEQRSARQESRRQKELEKNRKIKSALYVQDSDEESDDEKDRAFFEQEAELRQRQQGAVIAEMIGSKKIQTEQVASRKRKLVGGFVDSDSEDDIPAASAQSVSSDKQYGLESDEEAADETPLSSPRAKISTAAKRPRLSSTDSDDELEVIAKDYQDTNMPDAPRVEDEDEEDDVPIVRPVRRRQIGAFVDDSDDE